MAMGQAAGTAAALAFRSRKTPREIASGSLQDRLRAMGAVLETPSPEAAAARSTE
jgi:hypothetical protein